MSRYIILAAPKDEPQAAWQFDPQVFDTEESAERRRTDTTTAYANTDLGFKVVVFIEGSEVA